MTEYPHKTSGHNTGTTSALNDRLDRLARICANTCEAFSTFVVCPREQAAAGSSRIARGIAHELSAFHSLSGQVVSAEAFRASGQAVDHGVIGWVSKKGKVLSAAPFESENYERAFYKENQGVKSLLAIPIELENSSRSGVIACDSKKPYAFNRLHEKLLTDLAGEISCILNSSHSNTVDTPHADSPDFLQDFFEQAQNLIHALKAQTIQLLRLNCLNFSDVERQLGIEWAVSRHAQFAGLIRQAIPEKFPCAVLPNGDIIVLLDRMMGSFYENRLLALADHLLTEQGHGLFYAAVRKGFPRLNANSHELTQLIARAGLLDHQREYLSHSTEIDQKERSQHEYRTA